MTSGIAEQAESIFNAHRERVPFDQSTALLEIASFEDACAIQSAYVDRLTTRCGPRAGYKIGLTSYTMQEMCGIDHPVPGRVLGNRVHPSGVSFSAGDCVHPGIEFEIAVRFGSDLLPTGGSFDIADVSAAVDGACPAFEIIDDRNSDYTKLDVRALVADNSWNAGAVLGEFRRDWPDLSEVHGTIECGGAEIDTCRGRDILGHPLAPVAWLANHLAARGTHLKAGDIVLTGSMARTRFVAPGENYRMRLAGLGMVEVSFVP